MNTSKLFRQLIGIGDSELIFLTPVLRKNCVDFSDINALRLWCLSGAPDRLAKVVATAKMTLLGVFDISDMGAPIEILNNNEVDFFPPAVFLKWKILSASENAKNSDNLSMLLSYLVKEDYPPALTAFAFQKKESGIDDEFTRLIERAATLGDPVAMHLVGEELLSRSDSSKHAKGIELVRAAADAGYFWACNRMEMIYQFGRYGVLIDMEKANHYAAAVDLELQVP